jgi:hypothetical protein
VSTGQQVRAGDVPGLCGNSGNTTEPHLHFHLQDGPNLGEALGLPVTFVDYVSNGQPVSEGTPVQGELLRPPTEQRPSARDAWMNSRSGVVQRASGRCGRRRWGEPPA